MTDQEKDIKGIIKNSANKQSNAPVVKEELIGRYDRKKTISLIRYVLQKMEDKNTPFVPLRYTLVALYNSLALLSDLEPRVMTLDEVLAHDYKDGPLWLETIDNVITCGFAYCYKYYVQFSIPVMENEYLLKRDTWNWTDTYNKIWRCWTSRPTDEQREATPWES